MVWVVIEQHLNTTMDMRERERDGGHLGQDLASKMKKASDRTKG